MLGCDGSSPFTTHISEGTIEYDVTYPTLDSNNLMLEMLPDKMVMRFKNNRYVSTLSTAGGIVEMGIVADLTNKQVFNKAKIFTDRYVLKMNAAEAQEFSDVLPPFQVEYLDDSEVLAEAHCSKVLLDFGTAKTESYVFCYTDEIDLNEPNWHTPYHDIKGVLLDYIIENYGMTMRLQATRIVAEPVDDSEFEVGDDYRDVSADEFDKLVVKNLEMFLE